MTFGSGERNSWGLPTAVEEESFKMMDRYFECGGNFIDTGEQTLWMTCVPNSQAPAFGWY
jgi:hypothetical protein